MTEILGLYHSTRYHWLPGSLFSGDKAEIVHETQNRYNSQNSVWRGSAVRGEGRVPTLRRARCAGVGDGCNLFVRWVMLRALVAAKPVAFDWANEAHAVRMHR